MGGGLGAITSWKTFGLESWALNPKPKKPKKGWSLRAINPKPKKPKKGWSLRAINPKPIFFMKLLLKLFSFHEIWSKYDFQKLVNFVNTLRALDLVCSKWRITFLRLYFWMVPFNYTSKKSGKVFPSRGHPLPPRDFLDWSPTYEGYSPRRGGGPSLWSPLRKEDFPCQNTFTNFIPYSFLSKSIGVKSRMENSLGTRRQNFPFLGVLNLKPKGPHLCVNN
jgi:hypothetical protein